jgi:hypothetical protein
MEIGPVEFIILDFPGNRFKGEIVPALSDLVDSGLIRILDLAFVYKGADGTVATLELVDLDEEEAAAFAALEGEAGGVANTDDLMEAAEKIPPDSSAALIVWENVWAARFAQAVRDAGGVIMAEARIPHEIVVAALEEAPGDF